MSKYSTQLIDIGYCFDYCMVPTERPLYAILSDVVQHGVDNPKHGTDCACLDKYIYEVRAHVARALPEIKKIEVDYDPEDPEDGARFVDQAESRQAHFAATFRIAHVLRCITHHL